MAREEATRLDGDHWRHCDVVMEGISEKPEEPIRVPFSDQSVLAISGTFIPCAMPEEMPHDLALVQLRNFLKQENPDITDDDFSLEAGHEEHSGGDSLSNEEIIYITPEGCTWGPPK